MLPDGRVGFIDFGIVGRVSPVTWGAVEALLGSAQARDFGLMARALVTLGATSTDVDIPGWRAPPGVAAARIGVGFAHWWDDVGPCRHRLPALRGVDTPPGC